MTLRLTLVAYSYIARRAPSVQTDSIMPLHTVTCRSGNRAETLRPRSLAPGAGHIENIMEEIENIYLSVDDIPEKTFGSTGHHQARMQTSPSAGAKLGACETIPLHKHSRFYRKMTLSPIRRLQCKARAQHLTDTGIKTAFNQTLIKPQNCRRIVALGAPRVGKTNILRRFLGQEFKEHYEATTEDFHTKLYHIRGQEYQIDILDAAGERHYPAKRRLSILTGDIFLLAFSVDNRESFWEVCELIKEINAAKSKLMKLKNTAKVPVVVCGNKMDLGPMARVVSRFEIDSILGSEGVAYFETSAKEGTGLPCVFSALAKQGQLPNETSPTEHQNISIHTYQLLCAGSLREWRPSQLNGPLATMYPLARRPSFQSDLEQVKHHGGQNKHEKCQIQ